MGDKVPSRKLFKLGVASLGMAFAVASGSMLSPAMADQAGPGADQLDRGRQLFVDWSCGSCHVLKDAGGQGHVGPSLDGNKMTKAIANGRISGGQGAMPGFGGMLNEDEIEDLATYIVANAKD